LRIPAGKLPEKTCRFGVSYSSTRGRILHIFDYGITVSCGLYHAFPVSDIDFCLDDENLSGHAEKGEET
jgi:hypothetical protein